MPLGIGFLADPEYRLPILNAAAVSTDVDDTAARSRLLRAFNTEIGVGLGILNGTAWRIGLMGDRATKCHVQTAMTVMKVGEVDLRFCSAAFCNARAASTGIRQTNDVSGGESRRLCGAVAIDEWAALALFLRIRAKNRPPEGFGRPDRARGSAPTN